MNRPGRKIFSLLLLPLLYGCALPFFSRTAGPAPIPQTPDYSGIIFDTPTEIRTPSPLPSETFTPTVTRDRGWIPSPTPEPTRSPFDWECVPDGSPDPCHRVLRDISVLPSGDGWAVGEQGVILRRSGGSWAGTDSPVESTVRRVFAVDSKNAWAVSDAAFAIGPGDFRFRSRLLRWNGTAWSVFETSEPLGFVVDLSFLSAKTGWGISFEDYGDGRVFHLIRWNGSVWEIRMDTPVLNAIQMVSPSSGWAVGDGGAIFHWNGAKWSAVDSPTGANLDGVAFSSPGDGWATGRDGVIIRYSLGQWWDYSSLAPSPRAMAVGPDGEDGWMLGSWNRGDIVLRWDGKDWVTWRGDTPDGEALALDFPAAGEAWAAGWIPGRSRAGMVWRWDGASWNREFNNVPLPLIGASFLSANEAWGVGDEGWIVRWDGAEWSEVASPTGQELNAVTMLSPTEGWAAGEGGQILGWNGTYWAVYLPYQARGIGNDALYYKFNALSFNGTADGWVAGSVEGGDFRQPWIMRWDGAEWDAAKLFDDEPPCKCSLYAMHFSAPDDGWAVGGGDQTLIMHWDGAEWTYQTWPEAYRLLAIHGAAADDLWAAGIAEDIASSANPGVILHWDGSQWVPYRFPSGVAWMDAIHMDSASDGWMAGSGLLHWNGSEWGAVPSPVEGVIIRLERTGDGTLWGVTDTGSVLRLEGG